MRLTILLATLFTPYHCNVVEQYCVVLWLFRMPFHNLNVTPPSTADTGGLGLLSKPLDNPVEQQLVVCKAGRHHDHGEIALREKSKRH